MNPWQRVVWVVTLGPLFALPWFVLCGVAALTVVALPWAKAGFQVAMWIAWPTAEVPTSSWEQGSNLQDPEQPSSTTGYLVWVAVAGLWLSVMHHIAAALLAFTIVGILVLFPHLEVGRVALALNPAAFRMAPAGERRFGMRMARQPTVATQPNRAGVNFP
jgi:uncharacterized membrane protein YccF (DUF307 family)